ncbi:DUF4345 family protein [Tsuneonella mangrovi]|uniref:DUF4345 family protein n=1 Tax=Tsuneonella mangrovi TaxID=1982042 RepID=UPI000BA221A5|nr:DUF4345 family protein [Tsuneonella mangrovi]
MRLIVTALLFAVGLLFILLGLNFLVFPVNAGGGFGLNANGAQGLAVLRADFPAMFFVGGATMLWGAWKRNGELLLVPAAIFGLALLGRFVSLALDGTYPAFWLPMAVEATAAALALIGSKVLPHEVV